MSRTVFCLKLNKKADGLTSAPYPGALGERIYQHISAEAWQMWLEHQTMLINEYRLNMLDAAARKMLATEMEKFLFDEEGSAKPEGFVPPES